MERIIVRVSEEQFTYLMKFRDCKVIFMNNEYVKEDISIIFQKYNYNVSIGLGESKIVNGCVSIDSSLLVCSDQVFRMAGKTLDDKSVVLGLSGVRFSDKLE